MIDIDKLFYDMRCKKRVNIFLTYSILISTAGKNIYNLGVLTL